jgi:hypothetical protein
MDNRSVVPYNLSASKYRLSHKCGNLRLNWVKYLYKYIHMAADASVAVTGNATADVNEIAGLSEGDCLCRSLRWRLLDFPMQGRSHAVYKLPVHLEGQQIVTFGQENDLAEVVRRLSQDQITACETCAADACSAVSYTEFAYHFVYSTATRA